MTERTPVQDDGPYDSTDDDLREELSCLIDLSSSLQGFADLLDKYSIYEGKSEHVPWLLERVAATLHLHAREALRICGRLEELLDKVHINIEPQRGASGTPRPVGEVQRGAMRTPTLGGAARPAEGQKGGAK